MPKSMTLEKRRSIYAPPEDPEMVELLVRASSNDQNVARAAQREIAKALELPLRQGILAGNVIDGIFEPIPMPVGAAPEFPLDILAPGTEKEFVAYTIPYHGRIPERTLEGDYIMVPTYEVGSSIDWPLRLASRARWDIVGRAMEIFEASFVKKLNNDGWHTLLAAGADRGLVVFDGNAGQGRFTLRLISLLQQAMRRHAGGNTTAIRRGRLTDLYMSVESLEDMRSWTLAEVDEVTRREIFQSEDGALNRIYNVNLHDLIEFGVGQEYQNYYLNELHATLASGDVELVVGLDMQRADSFVMPITAELEVFEDDNMHRQRRAGVYGWAEHGFAVLDNRRIILGSL
jgi:hypothetical protein